MVVLEEIWPSFSKACLNDKGSWRKGLYYEVQPDTGRDPMAITLLNESTMQLNSLSVKQQIPVALKWKVPTLQTKQYWTSNRPVTQDVH